VEVPSQVQECLSGEPTVGGVDLAFAFLTTDPQGFPHVCLLSRAQLEADETAIRAVVYSNQTKTNLDRDGRACLIAVSDDVAHYCKLIVEHRISDGSLVGYSLTLHHHKLDAVPGSALTGMTYHVTAAMPQLENWSHTRRMLAQLR
jgi:hypothetical protein